MDYINKQYTFIGEHYRQERRKAHLKEFRRRLIIATPWIVFLLVGLAW